jgi:hypothetical protein
MFLFLVDSLHYGFWGNKVGDIFVDNTIRNLSLDESKVKVLHFFGMRNHPEFYELSGNTLVEKLKSFELDESDPENPIQVEVTTNGNTFIGEVYFENGVMVKPC